MNPIFASFVILCFAATITAVPLNEDGPGCLQQQLLDVFTDVMEFPIEDTKQGISSDRSVSSVLYMSIAVNFVISF